LRGNISASFRAFSNGALRGTVHNCQRRGVGI
jgi:hypothetical protein